LCGTGTPFALTVTINPVASINPMTATACGLALFTVTPQDVTNGVVPGRLQRDQVLAGVHHRVQLKIL
jgi:hypothetical protein